MKIRVKKWILSASLLLVSALVHAEGGCPAGMIPHSGTDVSSCGPIPPGYGKPQGHWVTQWGAFAQGSDGTAGLSSNQSSREAAKQAAINNCEARGGKQCVADDVYTYHNTCIAIVNGRDSSGQDRGTVYMAPKLKEAVQSAMKACKSSGKTDCKLFRVECSPAKWISD